MNESEDIAEKFLKSLNVGRVCYEPLGRSTTPDFAIDNEIGVEVRELNNNYILVGGEKQGFRSVTQPILDGIRKMFKDFGTPEDDECWLVSIRFQRPVSWRGLQRKIKAELGKFKNEEFRCAMVLPIAENFVLELNRSARNYGSFFFLWIIEDADVGGPVLANVEKNLNLCILEKEEKVSKFRHYYHEWWLVLINYVDLNMERDDYEKNNNNHKTFF